MQGTEALRIHRTWVGTTLDQQPNDLQLGPCKGCMQSNASIRLPGVDVAARV